MKWYWLSFADEKFLGGCYVDVDAMPEKEKDECLRAPNPKDQDFLYAVRWAKILGINPGGQVRGAGPVEEPAVELQNRLLSKEDLQLYGGFVSGKEIS